MPFGAGPRMCPGRYLALLEMKMAMAQLLGHFDIESLDTPDGQEGVASEKGKNRTVRHSHARKTRVLLGVLFVVSG